VSRRLLITVPPHAVACMQAPTGELQCRSWAEECNADRFARHVMSNARRMLGATSCGRLRAGSYKRTAMSVVGRRMQRRLLCPPCHVERKADVGCLLMQSPACRLLQENCNVGRGPKNATQSAWPAMSCRTHGGWLVPPHAGSCRHAIAVVGACTAGDAMLQYASPAFHVKIGIESIP
jgi:hypothetical protein